MVHERCNRRMLQASLQVEAIDNPTEVCTDITLQGFVSLTIGGIGSEARNCGRHAVAS